MKKIKSIILGITLAHFTAIYAQDCSTISMSSSYNYMEVLEAGKFEKFNKTNKTDFSVYVMAKDKRILLIDSANNFKVDFTIIDCAMLDSTLVYDCMDIKNKRICRLTFGTDKYSYLLTVDYEVKPVIYRVRRLKQEN